MSRNQRGFHLTAVLLAVVILGVIGFAGWKVMDKSDKKSNETSNSSQTANQSSAVVWRFIGDGWEASGDPPACPDPLKLQTPTDQLSKATHMLYPGQQRSTGYKTHGGFLFNNSATSEIKVKAPMDSHLIKASRYIEQGNIQYFMVFSSPCGISYRFDHLLELSPKFQAMADKLPEAKVDDSRTKDLKPPLSVKAGEEVGTAVGFKGQGPVSFDFGVLDLRTKNKASQNTAYAAKHADDKEYAPYAICWFDLLNDADAAFVKSLPPGDSLAGATSDYC